MDQEEINIHDLYPELSQQELKEAEANIKKYLQLVKKIFDGLSEEEHLQIAIRFEWEKRFKDNNSASQN